MGSGFHDFHNTFKNHLDILNLESITSQRHATGFQLSSYLQGVKFHKCFQKCPYIEAFSKSQTWCNGLYYHI